MQAELASEVTSRTDLADVLEKTEDKMWRLLDEDVDQVIQNGR